MKEVSLAVSQEPRKIPRTLQALNKYLLSYK